MKGAARIIIVALI